MQLVHSYLGGVPKLPEEETVTLPESDYNFIMSGALPGERFKEVYRRLTKEFIRLHQKTKTGKASQKEIATMRRYGLAIVSANKTVLSTGTT